MDLAVTLKQRLSSYPIFCMNEDLRVRILQIKDFCFSFDLRNSHEAYKWFHTNTPTTPIRHFCWFLKRLLTKRDQTLVACKGKEPVAICYLSRQGREDQCILSISVALPSRRTGVGEYLLRYVTDVERNHGFKIFNASIHVDNLASLSLFRRVGFTNVNEVQTHDNFVLLKKEIL